jgi:hypothetical protein
MKRVYEALPGYGAAMPKICAALVATLLLALPATAPAAQRTKPHTVAVDVSIDSFGVQHGRPIAHATAHTLAYNRRGQLRQTQRKTTLAVSTAASGCKILTLHLEKLRLVLLGLTVDTSAVNLHITGSSTGSLGKLFCKLANGLKLASIAKVAHATRAINRKMHGRRLHMFHFRAAVSPQTRQAPAAVCPVLDLTLGPLNLYLLGLAVDLYGATPKDPIVVTITADPNGGVLGKLFCELASNAQQNATA